MANPSDPKRPKPAVPLQPNYGATRSDAGATAPPAKALPSTTGAAARYGATTADSSASTPAGGKSGSGYQIIALIGEGGMGQVHLARDASLDRIVALKRIGREHVANERLRQRFFTEARASSRLTHYHIVQVFRLDEDEHGPFIAMEYVAGPLPSRRADWPANLPNPPLDLEEYVKLKGPLGIAAAVQVGTQLLSAVGYAHQSGVIHRDIKPANILLNAQTEPKLADFGLARQIAHADEGRTMAGAPLLTIGYGAPEQEIDASRADHRADLYAAAATLWFVLTGQSPRHFRESEVPQALRAILVRGMAKDREKRFQSAADFAKALEQAANRPEPAAGAVAPPVAAAGGCPKCGHVHAAGHTSKFCEGCGSPLVESCLKCGHTNAVGAKFCGSCGRDIAAVFIQATQELAMHLAQAQVLAGQGAYAQAIQQLEPLAALKHPRLSALTQQAAALLQQTRAAYTRAQQEHAVQAERSHQQAARARETDWSRIAGDRPAASPPPRPRSGCSSVIKLGAALAVLAGGIGVCTCCVCPRFLPRPTPVVVPGPQTGGPGATDRKTDNKDTATKDTAKVTPPRDVNAKDFNAKDFNAKEFNAKDFDVKDFNVKDFNAKDKAKKDDKSDLDNRPGTDQKDKDKKAVLPPGDLVLTTSVEIRKDTSVWVEIDDARKADWLGGTKQVRISGLAPGPCRVVVLYNFMGKKGTVFTQQATILSGKSITIDVPQPK